MRTSPSSAKSSFIRKTADKELQFQVVQATEIHLEFAPLIVGEMEASAQIRGTGISKRTPEFIQAKMTEGKAIIALASDGRWAGFCYIESWTDGKYVVNSGLIVAPEFRQYGLAKQIKNKIFLLSRKRYPQAKIFGLTTTSAVMKINSALGYKPVAYAELTTDDQFWAGCKSCVNYAILQSKERKNCLCTAMLYDPEEHRTRMARVASRVSEALSKVGKKETTT